MSVVLGHTTHTGDKVLTLGTYNHKTTINYNPRTVTKACLFFNPNYLIPPQGPLSQNQALLCVTSVPLEVLLINKELRSAICVTLVALLRETGTRVPHKHYTNTSETPAKHQLIATKTPHKNYTNTTQTPHKYHTNTTQTPHKHHTGI